MFTYFTTALGNHKVLIKVLEIILNVHLSTTDSGVLQRMLDRTEHLEYEGEGGETQ